MQFTRPIHYQQINQRGPIINLPIFRNVANISSGRIKITRYIAEISRLINFTVTDIK